MNLRKCNKCGEEKDREKNFFSFISDGKWLCFGSTCKSCLREKARNRRRNDEVFRAKDNARHRAMSCAKCRECGIVRDASVPWGTDAPNPEGKKRGRKSFCLKCFEARQIRSRQVRLKCKRQYRLRNKKIEYQRCRDWVRRNPEKSRAYYRSNYYKNKKRFLEYGKAWAKANPEKKRAHLRKWTAKNYDKVLHRNRVRRAMKRGAMTDQSYLVTKAWFDAKKAELNHQCPYCLSSDKPLTEDHIFPLIKGGKHVRENIVPCCKSCNSKKGDSLLSEWRPWLDVPLYGLELASA